MIINSALRPSDYDYLLEVERELVEILEEKTDNTDPNPLTSEELTKLIDSFPIVTDDKACLVSESCAQSWMDDYNYLLGKLYEKGSYISFKFETDINKETQQAQTDYAFLSNRFAMKTKDSAKLFLEFCENWEPRLQRSNFGK